MKTYIIAALLLIAPASNGQTADEKAPSILGSTSGRFVFGQIGQMRADQYMLDTQTGRLWQIVVNKDGAKSLEPVGYYSILGEKIYIPDTIDEVESHKQLVRQNTAAEFKRNSEAKQETKK